MRQVEFNELPLLLRRRDVAECLGLKALGALNGELKRFWVAERRARSDAPYPSARAYYLKCSVAPLIGLEMDWSEFESWPEVLHRYHLLRSGLKEWDIPRLVESGWMLPLAPRVACATKNPIRKHGTPEAWRKCDLAAVVGYQTLVFLKEVGLRSQ